MTLGLGDVLGPGMDHHRRVDAVEGAGLDEPDLAAAALLGGRAEERDAQAELVGHGRQRNGRPTEAAAMTLWPQACPTVGKRVVFGADRDVEGPGPERCR